MTIQIAVKLEDEAVAKLDSLVADGSFSSRSQAVRTAVEAMVRSSERRRIDAAFAESPPAGDRLHRGGPLGAVVVARGEIWWGEAPDGNGRPYLVVSRDGANPVRELCTVAAATLDC